MIAGLMSGPAQRSGADDLVTQGRDGAVIRVRVKPRSRRRGVLGVVGSELSVGVAAAPEGGRATAEAQAIVARWLGVPPSHLSLASGASSRSKRFVVPGETASALRELVADLLRRNPS